MFLHPDADHDFTCHFVLLMVHFEPISVFSSLGFFTTTPHTDGKFQVIRSLPWPSRPIYCKLRHQAIGMMVAGIFQAMHPQQAKTIYLQQNLGNLVFFCLFRCMCHHPDTNGSDLRSVPKSGHNWVGGENFIRT